jgi:hypothetical protein
MDFKNSREISVLVELLNVSLRLDDIVFQSIYRSIPSSLAFIFNIFFLLVILVRKSLVIIQYQKFFFHEIE